MSEDIPDNEQERQRLQALADIANTALLMLKKTAKQKAQPIGPEAAANLLRQVTTQEELSGLYTLPVAAVEAAKLDMDTWNRAVQSELLEKKTLDGTPVFVINKYQHIKGAGLIEHSLLDRLEYISQQDPKEWRLRVKQSLSDANSCKNTLH